MVAVYQEFIEFIAASIPPETLIAFSPSPEAKERIADLIHREKTVGLKEDETCELQNFLQLEHIMRLAKARARKRLANESGGAT